MLAVDKLGDDFLYQQVIELIGDMIHTGTLRPGDRLPSLRRLSEQVGVSVPTVKQAYIELERQGRVVARPQSGFYVQVVNRNRLVETTCKTCQPVQVRCRSLVERVYEGIHRSGVIPLGIANPTMARPAAKCLHRTMKRVMARAQERSLSYAPTTGEPGLKRQLAYRLLEMGGRIDPDQIIITNGGQEALALALGSVASAGDVIAVESPTYHGSLELIESLGMLAVEIETCAEAGVVLSALEKALDRHSIKACLFSSVLNNPLGSATDDQHRDALVELLEDRGVVLIEDDVYGELLFVGTQPRPAQIFSRKGLVLTCSSFSKTAAPGYRIGWLLPGKFEEQAHRLKRAWSCSSGLLQQLTLAEFVATGDFDRHLNLLRPVLRTNSERMSALVSRFFPGSTRTSRPQGGSVLWLQLPKGVDSVRLFDRALEMGVSTAPGPIFSPAGRYRNCLRLSFGHPWSPQLEQAIETLGQLTHELA